jgi:hypothetical protein
VLIYAVQFASLCISISYIQDKLFAFSQPCIQKLKTGTAKGERLWMATHLDQSNHLANRQQVLGYAVHFASLSCEKGWAKTILLNQTGMV